MGYVDWLGKLDINKLIDSIFAWFGKIIQKVFGFFALIPDWVKWGVFSLIVAFAIFMLIVLVKRRHDWKKVYS